MAHADRTLIFNPEDHPTDTLKSLDEFTAAFQFRYAAEFPDPPRVSMDAAIERWKYANISSENPNPKPTLAQYDEIRDIWIQKDMVAKFIGLFSTQRLQADWIAAEPNDDLRKQAQWPQFITKLRAYYKPTDNPVLVNYHFRSLTQQDSETFHGFCNRVEKESKTCYFKCESPDCNADKIAVRDQVVIGTTSSKIKEEALLKSWDLASLRHEGMKIESAIRGESEISNGDKVDVHKLGKYSYKTMKNNYPRQQQPISNEIIKNKQPPPNRGPMRNPQEKTCYNCGYKFKGNPTNHLQMCTAKDATCRKCGRVGHFFKMCRSKDLNHVQDDDAEDDGVWSVNLFRVESGGTSYLRHPKDCKNKDFKAEVVVNNNIVSVVADTGAKVSVCGTKEAEKWGIQERMMPSKTKLKPYNSEAINVSGVSRCAVTFGKRSTPVLWHIIKGSCEPILGGNSAVQLGIIQFNDQPETLLPIRLINSQCEPKTKSDLQKLLTEYHDIFTTNGIGKMNNYQVIFCEDKSVKPVVTPPRQTHYHLEERVEEELPRMIKMMS